MKAPLYVAPDGASDEEQLAGAAAAYRKWKIEQAAVRSTSDRGLWILGLLWAIAIGVWIGLGCP